MIRKLLVAAVAATALASFAAPALAQTGGSTSLSGVSNGSVIAGTVTIRGIANANTGSNVRHLEITIDGARVASQDYEGTKESASLDYAWNTRNGKNSEYTVKVYATFSGGGSSTSSANVKVANEASTPTGVSAKYDGNNIIVSWNRNPEPDISGYRVERDGATIGTVYNTSIADNPGAGTYSYRVYAIRYSPVGDKVSAPSSAVSATVPAAASNDSGGSGGTGGYYSGDGSSSSGGYYSGGGDGGSSCSYYGGGNGGSNGGVAGYGGGKSGGGKKGGGGNGGSSDDPWGGFGYTGSRMIGSLGIPNLTLPGSRGALSPTTQDSLDWGDYDPTLPYDLSGQQGGAFPEEFLGGRGLAAVNDYTVIPPDGLRWVAAGLWFIVAAALLKFLERRLALAEAAAIALPVTADGDATEATATEAEAQTSGTQEIAAVAAEALAEEAPVEEAPAVETAAAAAVTEGSAPKKTATKKPAAKKTTARKPAAKKTTARKTTAKKTTAKKVAAEAGSDTAAASEADTAAAPAKKTTARKTTAKKTTARKTTAKKTTAKKTTAKKTTARKPAARKTAAKKVETPVTEEAVVQDDVVTEETKPTTDRHLKVVKDDAA